MRHLLSRFFITFLTISVLASCGPDYLFEAQQDIRDSQWAYADTLNFQFEVRDTTSRCDFFLDFDYAEDFPFQNIYLKLSTLYPNGKRLSKMRSFDLFDAQGRALGKGSGAGLRLRTSLQDNAFFNQTGPYTVTVEQYTRREALPGVRSVGLAVVKRK
jgi:gliding motility-associated lipoprotein GldH